MDLTAEEILPGGQIEGHRVYEGSGLDLRLGNRILSSARIVLCLALLGAVLGFLPHNFKPASIFLGDCGSLLLGYMCVVIILMLGDRGRTYFVFAGLIVFAVPVMMFGWTSQRKKY